MPSVHVRCRTCGYRAKRAIVEEPGSRGVHEAPCEPGLCPAGHGALVREDGGRVARLLLRFRNRVFNVG